MSKSQKNSKSSKNKNSSTQTYSMYFLCFCFSRAFWVGSTHRDTKMWTKSKIADQTAAGQGGEYRLQVFHAGCQAVNQKVREHLSLQLAHPPWRLLTHSSVKTYQTGRYLSGAVGSLKRLRSEDQDRQKLPFYDVFFRIHSVSELKICFITEEGKELLLIIEEEKLPLLILPNTIHARSSE